MGTCHLGSSASRVPQPSTLAALLRVKPGQRPRLIYRIHHARSRRNDPRKGITETDCAALLDATHQQLHGPIILVWDNLNVHVSDAMTSLIQRPPDLEARGFDAL